MKKIKSLKSQLVLQFAIIILPVITILLYQTVSDIYQDEELARSYHYLNTCHGIKSKYTQFINGAVLAVDSGQLGIDALRALEEATEQLGHLAEEDHAGNFVKLQGTMANLLTALRHDRSITALLPLRESINRADAGLGNEYARYEKGNRQAIEANIAFAQIQKIAVFGAIFVTFLLSMLVGRLMARSITRPITEAVAFAQSVIKDSFTELAHGATRFAQGDLPTQVKVKATGEVQMLVDSINRMAEDLEERSRELLEVQGKLLQEEKLAMLGRIAGNMGNELRNPLGVMSNAVFFLKEVQPDADETVREYLGIIGREIDNSQRIISDLLDFFQDRPIEARLVPVPELVRQSLERAVIPVNVRCRADLPETLPAVRIDPLQIGEVLCNLIANAVQAMPDGGALLIAARRVLSSELRVLSSNLKAATSDPKPDTDLLLTSQIRFSGSNSELKTQNSELDGDFIEISVADTGEGIAPEHMERLFQPLFSTKSRGIGLGLAISRKLAEANGGGIEVESRLEKGTTFRVTLPAGGE